MLGLQRLFYGPLRPIEVEQLYEKAWFAVTETCLAMTIFREEVGGWFLVMFISLLIGKVWGWIGEGRVEILEQQPPANPRLFHARLSFSLFVSMAFDTYMLNYSVRTVLRQARPNMMVMFAFEFAVLTIASSSTAARYIISLVETLIINKQTMAKLEERRAERRAAREQTHNTEPTEAVVPGTSASTQPTPSTEEENVDESDIDVPGWEEKGRWIFYLDLATDFLKLFVYISFFSILLTFYGLPIHIMRDLFITTRSFIKRISDFLRYRNATRDMNARYPDASAEEVGREEVCIICREEMRPWQQANNAAPGDGGARPPRPATTPVDERSRPKKLPCGHILHFGCLRSWLERQQNCPTCRRPVLVTDRIRVVPNPRGGVNAANQPPGAQGDQQHPQGGAPGQPNNAQADGGRGRIVNFGPFRIGFGLGPPNIAEGLAQRMNEQQGNAAGRQLALGFGFGRQPANQGTAPTTNTGDIPTQLHHIEQQLMQQINTLRSSAEQLQLVRALQGELARLRIAQANPGAAGAGAPPATNPLLRPFPPFPQASLFPQNGQPFRPTLEAYAGQGRPALGPGHPDLPAGMTLPAGWTVLPLQRAQPPLPQPRNESLPAPHNPLTRPLNGILRPTSTSSPLNSNPITNLPSASTNSSSAPVVAPTATGNAEGSRQDPFAPQNETAVNGNTSLPSRSLADPPRTTTNGVPSLQPDATGQPTLSPDHFRNLALQHNTSLSSHQPQATEPAWRSSNQVESYPRKEAHVPPDAPRASSAATNSAANEQSPPLTAEQRREQKGKGKAATVEDFTEDVE
ncbi:MAG: E3 ubiquitin-protein ligase hrd1 [Candelina mexicana]|nr:MAG: E3 ubiquitin-protein ligase hrd1 [Candelina mexicana]